MLHSVLGMKKNDEVFWECFCSDSTEKNFLRLFGTKEMAVQYGMRGKEVLKNRIRENGGNGIRNTELRR